MWFQVNIDRSRHPKLARLCETLGEPRHAVMGRLDLLWGFTLEFAPNGNLGQYTHAEIAEACDWSNQGHDGRGPDFFVGALVETGWLDWVKPARNSAHKRAIPTLWVHHWSDYSAKYLRYSAHRNERKRKLRAAQKQGDGTQTAHTRHTDGTDTAHDHFVPGTQTAHTTVQDSTGQDIKPPTPFVPRHTPPGQINAGRSVPNVEATRDRIRRMREDLRP